MTTRQLEAALEALSLRLAGPIEPHILDGLSLDDYESAHQKIAAELARRPNRKRSA